MALVFNLFNLGFIYLFFLQFLPSFGLFEFDIHWLLHQSRVGLLKLVNHLFLSSGLLEQLILVRQETFGLFSLPFVVIKRVKTVHER